jgi:hypothetical protein
MDMTTTRVIGPFTVPAIGLGCMPLSGMPPSKQWILNERDTALGVVHAALDAGVRLLDTADIYAPIGGIDTKDSLENGSYDAKARSISVQRLRCRNPYLLCCQVALNEQLLDRDRYTSIRHNQLALRISTAHP